MNSLINEKPRRCLATTLLLCLSSLQFMCTSSFQPSPVTLNSRPSLYKVHAASTTQLYSVHHVVNGDSGSSVSRRQIFQLATNGVAAASLLFGMPDVSSAAVATPAELKKLQLGHSRVQYLLANWDTLTSTCNNKAMSSTEQKQVIRTEGGGGGFCDRSPLIVQEYIGYKSTEDPLYKADKLMLRSLSYVNDSVMDQEDFVDLVERFRENADNTSLLSYTSSWGEANPNGGKEVVDEYLERTKDLVLQEESLLRQVLKALDLEILSPSRDKKA